MDALSDEGMTTDTESEGGLECPYPLLACLTRDGESSEGTNDPGPAYCLLVFGTLGVAFFSGAGACQIFKHEFCDAMRAKGHFTLDQKVSSR